MRSFCKYFKSPLIRFLILTAPTVIIWILLFYPFPIEPIKLFSLITEEVPTGANYNYFTTDNKILGDDGNGNYVIDQDTWEKESQYKTLITKIFGSSIGIYEICFQNKDSTYYLHNFHTRQKQPIDVRFNDENLKIESGDTVCKLIFANEKFALILNTKLVAPEPHDMIDFMKNNKEYHQFAETRNFDPLVNKPGDFMPILFADVYIKPYFLTFLISMILLFLIWSGIIFTVIEIPKFIRGKPEG